MRETAKCLGALLLFSCFAQHAVAGDPFDSAYPNLVVPTAQFGEWGSGIGQFNEPSDVDFVDEQAIAVAECFNNRIQIVTTDGEPVSAFSTVEIGLACPIGVSFRAEFLTLDDDVGPLFAILGERGDVVLSSIDGELIASLESPDIDLVNPVSIILAEDRVFVLDSAGLQIFVLQLEGDRLEHVSSIGLFDYAISPTSMSLDDAGNFYLTDRTHRVVRLDPNGAYISEWGEYGSLSGEMAEPSDIYVRNASIYVSDLTNHRLQAFDLNGDFILQWGRHPVEMHQGLGHTHYPTSIAASPSGETIVVCEQFEYRCQVFESGSIFDLAQVDVDAWWEKFPQFHYGGGARIAEFEELSPELQQLLSDGAALTLASQGVLPAELATADQPNDGVFETDLLLVTEPDIHRAVLFAIPEDLRGMFVVNTVGEYGVGEGQLVMPSAKAIDTVANRIILGDSGSNNLEFYDLISGEPQGELFGPGDGDGEFHGPSFIEFAPNGNVYIGDFHNDRVQVFNENYEFLFEFGETGDGPGQLFGPLSAAFDPDFTQIYITDTGNQRVQVFDLEGNFLFGFGSLTRPGEWGEGTFQWPFDVAVAPDGSVYVSDPSLQLIQRFTQDGEFVLQWGGWGTQPGQFYKCKGLDVDSDGRVYVIDFGNHRGQVFDPNGQFLGIFGEGVFYPPTSAELESSVFSGPSSQ